MGAYVMKKIYLFLISTLVHSFSLHAMDREQTSASEYKNSEDAHSDEDETGGPALAVSPLQPHQVVDSDIAALITKRQELSLMLQELSNQNMVLQQQLGTHKAEKRQRAIKNTTLLPEALKSGNIPCVKILVDGNADVDHNIDGLSSLNYLLQQKHTSQTVIALAKSLAPDLSEDDIKTKIEKSKGNSSKQKDRSSCFG